MTSSTNSTWRSRPSSGATTARSSSSALYSVDDAEELLGAELPQGTWDTVGGLMLDLVGGVPNQGDSVEVDGFRLTALDVRGRRIQRVRIEPTGDRALGPLGASVDPETVASGVERGTDTGGGRSSTGGGARDSTSHNGN